MTREKPLPTILVIDDEPFNLKIINRALADEFKLILAESGEEALSLLSEIRPDLILLDIVMPGIDGFETCRRLKKNPELQHIPVMFMTGLRESSEEIQGLELGAVDYLLKPLRLPIVRQRIRNQLAYQTLRRAVDDQYSRLDAIINTLPDMLFELDRDGVYLGIWAHSDELLSQEKRHLLGYSINQKLPQPAASICMEAIAEADMQGASYGRVIELRLADVPHWFELSVSKIRRNYGTEQRFVMLSRDITERRQMEEQISRLAFYDPLTELPNRRLFHDRLNQAAVSSEREGHYAALIFLDIDNFKPLNDAHGHDVGDLLLREVAKRLTNCVRKSDTVARLGGDEFVVVLHKLSLAEDIAIKDAKDIAEKVQASLSAPYHLQLNDPMNRHVEHYCSASIGITVFKGTSEQTNNLIKMADSEMYKAKRAGRNSISIVKVSANLPS